ncbi:MAG TPA: hypothetical protein ENK55_00325 [Actinobacteria bacterium]|nr:hypothetical protein [Actinomycetota bacterium]
MNIIVFILIAGIWAAFLLPSFLEDRREAPVASTRAFARSRALLANVSTGSGALVASSVQLRRRRILVGLVVAAGLSLLAATVTGSVLLLWVTIGVDVALAAYVTLLLMLKQQRLAARRAPRIPATPPVPAVAPEVEDAPPTVRVIAG